MSKYVVAFMVSGKEALEIPARDLNTAVAMAEGISATGRLVIIMNEDSALLAIYAHGHEQDLPCVDYGDADTDITLFD